MHRRDLIRTLLGALALGAIPAPLLGCGGYEVPNTTDADRARLRAWAKRIRAEGLGGVRVPLGRAVARVGEFTLGTPYEAQTLEAYLKEGGSPVGTEPLTLSLTHFDCVTLVESCLAVARVASQKGEPTWEAFAQEVERMRYRGGRRGGYVSRLHYFSEWLSDGAKRGLVHDLGPELGGAPDRRPLRFMSTHRESYPALADETTYRAIAEIERGLDGAPRYVVPTARIAEVSEKIETGDVLAFATTIEGLDVTHAAMAYRDPAGVLRVLHAPLSGGVVEISRGTLQEYVAAIRRSSGVLVARPLRHG